MANKIYDFLPAHLKNRDLEDIFDATLERVFSKGSLEKTRAYVGRREKGINGEDDTYLSFPEHLFSRDNYGLEPVFTNDSIKDRIFYDDLLNAMFNKGMLTNDHRRLFESGHKTINLPIDADKFVNWQMYYWVEPQPLYYHQLDENGFGKYNAAGDPILIPERFADQQIYVNHLGLNMTSTNKPQYITIDDGNDTFWSRENSWEHHEDIRNIMSNDPGITKINTSDYVYSLEGYSPDPDKLYYIKNDNTSLFKQAKRPIIEFDKRLEVYNTNVTEWEVPQFTLYDEDNNPLSDGFTIFEYVQDELFTPDPILGIDVKTISGDYQSEFVFQITIPDGAKYKLDNVYNGLYIQTEFNYRNLRREYGRNNFTSLELPQLPVSANDVDVYVDGMKQNNNYTVSNNTVTFDKAVSGDVYVDLSTKYPVDVDGDVVWQRINPIIEFNPDNETHNLKEFTYSAFYEHFLRQIETTVGLVGEANASNNYRKLGQGLNKTQFNKYGSVMITHDTDVTKGYFAITRDDFDPIKAVEFLAGAFSSYKNKLVLKVQELVKEDEYSSKTNLELLENAISELALVKRESIDTFTGSQMILFGELYNHYDEDTLVPLLGRYSHRLPESLRGTKIEYFENLLVVVNDKVMLYGKDYKVDSEYLTFNEYMVQPNDVIILRYYSSIAETFIPPSAVSLSVSELYKPEFFVDNEYDPQVTFLRGHDGSSTPIWGDRTDDIMMMFETLIYNRNTDKSTQKSNLDLEMNLNYSSEYTFAEKRFTTYPFFKKWMIKNNIDDTRNTQFDPNDWKTWNYRALSDDIPGSWRSIINYVYGTEFIFSQPWLVLGFTEKPKEAVFGWVDDPNGDGYFENVDYRSIDFWNNLKVRAGATWPVPVNADGSLKQITDLFTLTVDDLQVLKQDWEFGDGSPEELAWRRNSEYPFINFLTKILLKPFKMLDDYDNQIQTILNYYNKREGYGIGSIVSQRSNYTFKLGSKLGGFVNNFQLFSERNSFSNTSKSEIPADNYDLFIHAGEPNRSESYSAIIVEKVSLDEQYPFYAKEDTVTYKPGDIVLRKNDNKYYKRKALTQTDLESTKEDASYFDYSAWVLVSQPNVKKFGYRVSGYDDFNPVFYTLDWDKTSGAKRWSSDGDLANIKQWTPGEYYRLDYYTVYNNKPYISLGEHQASESFDNDLADGKWKLVRDWPIVNTIDAVGYKEVLQDQLKIHNYGDILETLDDVAQLFVGYQEYLKLVGWDFTDLDEFSEVVDFETLLIQFLNWTRETHQVGDFITLTPVLRTGRFQTPYGVASVASNTNKNFYRVVDSSGRQLGKELIKFNIDGDGIVWESQIPVYGIKIDIQDIEHAFVVDREDSYGDLIYDPLSHNRSLRMLIDCNRTSDWNGTLAIDGYIASGSKLLPNLETMIEDSRYYRDTLVDQSLEIINKLKESQLGFAPKNYLTNHFIDRETQVEFYKGFLAGKATKQSINRIVNKKSNFTDVKHDEVWAFKLDDYGKTNNRDTVSKTVSKININSDPYVIQWDENGKFKSVEDKHYRTVPIKTSGYVNPDDVNYIVRNNSILESTVRDTFYEGDLAWIRFDEDREWDVKRLSEISEIAYVGETPDGQLYLGLVNEIDISDTVFLKIDSIDIDPTINGYFNLVDDGIKTQNGQTIYEYLVFDTEYEPFIVEIDETTDNSVFVPTAEDNGVEAIGAISNPSFIDGDTIYLNYSETTDSSGNVIITGSKHTFDSSSSGGSSVLGIQIGGANAVIDPYVPAGDEARIIVYDDNNNPINSNTVVRFNGTRLECDNVANMVAGQTITINNREITIANSSTQAISIVSDVNEERNIPEGLSITISSDDAGSIATTVVSEPIVITGTVSDPKIWENSSISIGNKDILFDVPPDILEANSAQTFQSVNQPVSSVTLTVDMTFFKPGTITVNDGVDEYELSKDVDYSYNELTKVITFNTPIPGGVTTSMVDDDNDPTTPDVEETTTSSTVNISVQLIAQPQPQHLNIDDIISKINSVPTTARASKNSDNQLVITSEVAVLELASPILSDLGLANGSYTRITELGEVARKINEDSSYATARINGDGKLEIETENETLSVSGDLADFLGFDNSSFNATSKPTTSSIVQQIETANIPGVGAESVNSKVVITFNGAELTVSGAIQDLGVDTTLSTITVKAIDSIIADIKNIVPSSVNVENYNNTDRLYISSTSVGAIELVNYRGNPWDDLGIETGRYSNSEVTTSSLRTFVSDINNEQTDVIVSISSDGRMIFRSNSVSLSFAGTETSVLDKIGLYENYSSTKSSANFKIMRWKSVRYTPNHTQSSFEDFLANLGINSYTKIWADDYLNTGWAVVSYNSTNVDPNITQPVQFLARQVEKTVDMDDIKRMVVRDGETFNIYQLYDPLNYKMPGSITKDIDYVDWQDPAKYDDVYSNDLWLSEHEGEIWWDTERARFYRYNDYGTPSRKVNLNYVKKYWGKLVPGSVIEIKQWKSANAVPDDIKWFNTETYWDTESNRSVTKYYFWSTIGIDVENKEYSIDEIKMLIESGGTTNKFLPIDDRTIITSNNANFKSSEIEYTVYKQKTNDVETKHVDWDLVSKSNTKPISEYYLNGLRDSLAGSKVETVATIVAYDEQKKFYDTEFEGLTLENCVISVDNVFLTPLEILEFNGAEIILSNDAIVYEGDIVRVYKIHDYVGWFSKLHDARQNFAAIVNDHMKRKMLVREIPNYKEHIGFGTGIFAQEDWAISEDFDTIRRYEYLSNTRNFDMIKMFRSGTGSFKIDLKDSAEYYFEYLGNLRLVHKENAALRVVYDELIQGDSPMSVYYDNVSTAQTFEFINMLYQYADKKFVKNMFFDMVDYMYTEKTYPDWIFKTSYIDLFMLNKPLRQYAIYQNDNYDDIIDYVNETKPYHTKIRKTERVYPYGETANADVDIYEAMDITLFFGEHSRYRDTVYDGGDQSLASIIDSNYDKFIDSHEILDSFISYFESVYGNTGYTATDDYAADTSIPNGLKRLYHLYTYNKHLIQKVRNENFLELTEEQQEIVNEWNILQQQYLLNPDNGYDAGFFLRRFNNLTSDAGGYDTGEFGARLLESMIMKSITFEDDTRTVIDYIDFYVYDMFGKGYIMPAKSISSVADFDGKTLTVQSPEFFRSAKDNTKFTVVVEKSSGEYEFMIYDYKSENKLSLSKRAVFNGISINVESGDTIYVV